MAGSAYGSALVRRVSAITRSRRFAMLLERFPDLESMSVLDLGGRLSSWTASPVHPLRLVTVNLEPPEPSAEPWSTALQGDACAPPDSVRRDSFDLVYSNSVIEHVGGHAKRIAYAEVVRAMAPRYWVQAPYRYFPVEPHWLFPGFQFLPAAARLHVARHWPLARRNGLQPDLDEVLWIELPSRTEMQAYFPDAELICERFAGAVKSLIALR